ncbi:MAG: tetratricopeptide repeat protein [Rhodobacteraceae bacterium]|nr:tetratricopeptide repeat protein [Paracoccaceae bacterium]
MNQKLKYRTDPKVINEAAALFRAGKLSEARKICAASLAKVPDPHIFNILGAIEIESGNSEKAVQAFRRATQLAPTNAEYYGNLALAHKRAGQADDAITMLERAVSVVPDSLETVAALGKAYDDAGKLENAVQIFIRASQKWPASVSILIELCYLHARNENLTDAMQCASRAYSIEPNNPVVQAALGEVHSLLGEGEKALQFLKGAIAVQGVPKAFLIKYAETIASNERVLFLRDAKERSRHAIFEAAAHCGPLELGPESQGVMNKLHAELADQASRPTFVVYFHMAPSTGNHPYSNRKESIDYIDLLNYSIASVGRSILNAQCVILSDQHTNFSALRAPHTLLRLPLDSSAVMYSRMQAYFTFLSLNQIDGVVLFLDSDVHINHDFQELVDGQFDIGLTYRARPGFVDAPINGGFIMVPDARSPRASDFLKICLSYYDWLAEETNAKRLKLGDLKNWNGDQLALGAFADWKVPPVAPKDVVIEGIRVRYLDCETYNYPVAETSSLSVLREKWALHFKGPTLKQLMPKLSVSSR